jgi:hypothetical protein
MKLRRVLGFAVVCSIAVGFTACGDSGDNGETQTTSDSPDDDSSGTAGLDSVTTDTVTTDGTANQTGPANMSTGDTETDSETGGSDDMEPENPGFCPAEQPEEGGECMNAFPIACTYGEQGCVCTENAWDCYSTSDCPAASPADGETCTLGGMACDYDGLDCTCDTTDGWSCSSPCPEAQPSDGVSCRRPSVQTCNYAGGVLAPGFMSMSDATCACSDETFVCFSEANCPADAPTTGGSCEFPTLNCMYEASDCQCNDDGTWECRTDCPESVPADGASCERPEQAACRYAEEGTIIQGGMGMGMGAEVFSTCACREGAFTCVGQEDCPADAPVSGDTCADLDGLACDYEGSSCNCGDMGWTCQTACPAAPPEDGVSCEREQPCRYAEGELLASGGFGGGGFGGGGGTAADTSCTCVDNLFDCFTAADCPMTLPAEDEACTVTGVRCVVEGQNCTCSGQTDTWNCVTPPDGGMDMSSAEEETDASTNVTTEPESEVSTTGDAGAL